MRLVVRVLGLDLLDIELATNEPELVEVDPMRELTGGTTYSTPIGFVDTPGDQRWERGVDYQ